MDFNNSSSSNNFKRNYAHKLNFDKIIDAAAAKIQIVIELACGDTR